MQSKHIFYKLTSLLLTTVMLLGLFAAMPLTAGAAGTYKPTTWAEVQETVNGMGDGDTLDLSELPINYGGNPGNPFIVDRIITISKSITVTSNHDPLGLAPGSAINPIYNLYFKLQGGPTVTFTNLIISSRDFTKSIVSGSGSIVVENVWFYSSFNDDTGNPPAQIDVNGDVLVKGTIAKNADGVASPTTAIGGIATTAAGGVPGAAIKANNVTVEGGAINGAPTITLGAASETSGNGIEASGNVTVSGSLVLLDGRYYNTTTIDGGNGMKIGVGDSNGGNAIVAGGSVTVNSGGIAGGPGVGEGSAGGIAIIAGGNISLEGERIVDGPDVYYSCWVRGGMGTAESGISIQFSGNSSSPTRYLTAETALICRMGGGAPADYTIYMQNNDVAILEDSRVGFSADDALPLFNGGSFQFINPERIRGTNGGARPYVPAGGSDNDNIDIAELTGDIAAGTYTKWSYEHSSRTITVTDNVNIIGTVTDATDKLKIKISDTKTVTWKANYSSAAGFTPHSLIEIDGKGTFDVADGTISSNKEAIRDIFTSLGNEATIKVSGGTVSTTGSDTSAIVGGIVEMSGGAVSTVNVQAIAAVFGRSEVSIAGGMVSATGANGKAIKANTITVSGASTVVKATGADGIAIDAGSNTVTVSGGTVEATGSNGIAIKASGASSIVTISGGTVSATTGAAISTTSTGSTVTVNGGDVSSASGSATIKTEGNVIVSGGSVVNTGGGYVLDVGAGGAGTGSVTLSGGTVMTDSDSVAAIYCNMGDVTLSGGYVIAPAINTPNQLINGASAALYPVTITGLPDGIYANPVAQTSGFEMKAGAAAGSGYNKAWMPVAASQTYIVSAGGTNYIATGAITAAGPNTLSFTAAGFVSDTVAIAQANTVAEIKAAIENALAVHSTVTVTGSKTNVGDVLSLNIPAGRTVLWKATYTAPTLIGDPIIYLYDDGTFEVATSGAITAANDGAICGHDKIIIKVSGTGTVNSTGGGWTIQESLSTDGITVLITGGSVTTDSGIAIYVHKGTLTLTGGTVSATTGTAIEAASIAVTGTAGVSVTGANPAIKLANNANLTLSGSGNLKARGGTGRVLELSGTGKVIFTDDNQVLELYNDSANDEVINLSQLSLNLPWYFDGNNRTYITSGNGNAANITITLPAGTNEWIVLSPDGHYLSTNAGTLASGRVGTAYSATILAVASTVFDTITDFDIHYFGSLPPGLTLNANGTITGNPTTAGTYTFAVSAIGEDTNGGAGFYWGPAVQYSITIGTGGGGGTTTTNASISQTKADFDKNGGKDISVTLSNGSYTLQSLKNGTNTLRSGTDYTVSGNTVTIKASYLSTLAEGEQTIIFDMSGGTDPKLTVTVKDTTAKPPVNPFTDIKEGAWYYNDVMFVYENELMIGTSATTFSPNSTLTRGMIVTLLWRMAGEPAPTSGNPFTDLTQDWYINAVIWAAENDIVEGYDGGRFGPENPVTREQMATLFWRYTSWREDSVSARADLSKYGDAGEISSWALDAMQWAMAVELIYGRSATELAPQGQATRAEAAAILHRFLGGE